MVELEEPDKGQAWVVAIAACIINMILSGLSRMIGMLYVAVIDTYGVSRRDATLPFTVRNAIRCLAGPVVGIIGQRYGIRAITIAGGIIATTGATLCFVAPSITWLAVFWGGIHGLGFAFANTLFQVVVNQYFEKYRATASGIALSGACFGSFVFPFVLEVILDTFGLTGGFLILGGIVMHVLPPSLLLKSPPWVENPVKYARLKALKIMQESMETLDMDIPETPPNEEEHLKDWRNYARTTSMDNCPVDEVEVCSATRSLRSSTEDLQACFESRCHHLKEKNKCKRNVVCTLYKIYESPAFNRRESGSNAAMNKCYASPIHTISGEIDAEKNNLKQSTKAATEKQPMAKANQTSFFDSIKGIATLYRNPAYVLINICMTTYVIIFIPILTVLVDYSKDKGIPESDGKYLINALAFGDLIGRLGFGWVTDKGMMSIPLFIALAFAFQGLFIALFPFALSFATFMLMLTLYGISAGTILVHFPLLVLKYMDMNLQAVAMGCVGFLSGIVSFAIPPMIGHFRDNVGSYDGMFYVTGAISVVSGGFWLLVPLVEKFQHKNQNNNEQQQAEESKNGHLETCKEVKAVSKSNGQEKS